MSYIETYSGTRVDLLNPSPEAFNIADIARGLAHTARFSGHTSRFYSVGLHSINVARLVPEEYKLAALMHDATEAYLGDMPTPFKALLPDFKAAENRMWNAICIRFDLPFSLPPIVKQADRVMLMTERDALKPVNGHWGDLEDTIRVPYAGLLGLGIGENHNPEQVKAFFMQAYKNYGGIPDPV